MVPGKVHFGNMATTPLRLVYLHFAQGHEGCGEIVSIGDEVTDTRFKIVSLIWLRRLVLQPFSYNFY